MIPTNMSTYNCDFSDIEYGYNKKSLKNDFQINDEYVKLNPNVYDDKYYKNLQKVCNNNTNSNMYRIQNGTVEVDNNDQFFYTDPRLYNGLHAQWITLDSVPLDCSMKLYDIPYDTKLNNYGQNYKSYKDINAGQITYYIDDTISQPFFNPNFVSPANIDGVLYKDSMDSIKPQYVYSKIKNDNPITTSKRSNYSYKLSSLEDTTNNREDLMSLQMSKINQQKYSARYFLK